MEKYNFPYTLQGPIFRKLFNLLIQNIWKIYFPINCIFSRPRTVLVVAVPHGEKADLDQVKGKYFDLWKSVKIKYFEFQPDSKNAI